MGQFLWKGPENRWYFSEALRFHRQEGLPVGKKQAEKKNEGILYLGINMWPGCRMY